MSKIDIAVIDYGMGNLRSVLHAVQAAVPEAAVGVTSSATEIAAARRIVFPGQSAMPDTMRALNESGLRDAVVRAAREKPFLGICLGLQMLFDESEEGPSSGLGILPGRVRHFAADLRGAAGERLKVPHMGWNQVRQLADHPLWNGIADGERFYFVHSYFVEPADSRLTVGVADYPVPFTCAVAVANIFAVQFHPEKSQQNGLQLLRNFAAWNGIAPTGN